MLIIIIIIIIIIICPLAESYVNSAAIEAGVAAEVAASNKEAKYADIQGGPKKLHISICLMLN